MVQKDKIENIFVHRERYTELLMYSENKNRAVFDCLFEKESQVRHTYAHYNTNILMDLSSVTSLSLTI